MGRGVVEAGWGRRLRRELAMARAAAEGGPRATVDATALA
jgi:hypothetical protein